KCSCVTCVNDSEACTRLLVATHGIDVNAQDDNGNTPLHIAIEHQLARCVEILISAGADVCLRSDSGEEPVGLLAKRLPDTMTYLLNECVFVDQYDPTLPAGVSPETLTLQVPTPSAAKCEIATGISSEVALILVSTMLLAAIELCKLVITPKLYLRGWVNYGTWIFIGLVLMTTVPNLDKQTSIGPYQYQAAALTVFLAWAFILQQISRFPSLGKYIEMFGQVLKSFGFFLLTFMSLFIAFALSFSILFPTNSAFTFFCYSVLKTCFTDGTVVTGPLLGHLLYAVFVLVISIVLMNLVIGLTVKDIQELQAQGELRRTAKLILSLYHLESFIFSNRIPRKAWDKLKASISIDIRIPSQLKKRRHCSGLLETSSVDFGKYFLRKFRSQRCSKLFTMSTADGLGGGGGGVAVGDSHGGIVVGVDHHQQPSYYSSSSSSPSSFKSSSLEAHSLDVPGIGGGGGTLGSRKNPSVMTAPPWTSSSSQR
ncbi:Transient receptor potential channel pyrexia, partial [Orchesella cincta]